MSQDKMKRIGHQFGPNFKRARESMGLSMRSVVERTGNQRIKPCSVAHLNSIEHQRADPTITMAMRYCKAIGVDLYDMIGKKRK